MIRTTGRALLIQDDQLLAVKYEENNQVFYALPGGGQKKGESLHRNLQRECREELGIDVLVGDLLFVCEWIDKEQDIHQIEFIFECSPIEFITHVKSDIPDGNQIGIEWLPISEIIRYHLYPLEMRPKLLEYVRGTTNIPVYLGEVQ